MKVLYIFLFCVVCAQAKVTPDYFPSCKRSDPQIEKCVLNGLEAMRPHLKEGIPEVNIPPLDPFTVPTLKLDRTAPNLRIKATVKQAKAYGGSDFKIEKLKLNLNNKYAGEMKITLPKLMVVANYDVRGSRLLALDINGKGRIRGNFTGITVVAKGFAKPINKENVEYLQVDKLVSKVRINHAQIAIDETERPVAAASAASFFNASPNVVLDILNPLIEETTAAVIKAFVNKVLGSIPITEVLIDDASAAPAA
uniref:Hemolymph juvenile hormone binding protein n=1 Tax=Heliothis virescens TaxID=7102 RepID=A0A2A4KA60_HELVI